MEEEPNAIQSTVVTPDDKYIGLRAIGVGSGTRVQFKAPTIDLLLLIDDFLRKLK
jgi:hypothetical protein